MSGSGGVQGSAGDQTAGESSARPDLLIVQDSDTDDLLACLPGVVFYRAEPPGDVGFVSDSIENILGFAAEEWRGHPALWEEQIHPSDRSPVIDKRRMAYAAGQDFRSEYRMYTKEGRIRWIREQSRPVPGQRGGICGLAIDVSDWMWSGDMMGEIHQDQLDLISDLRGASSRLRTSLRLMAHDARRPLATAQELLSRLVQGPRTEQQQAALLRGMVDRLAQLESLVHEVVEHERVDEGGLSTEESERVVLSALVSQALDDVIAGTHTVEVALADESVTVPRTTLDRVVRNLLWNAVTHTPPETVITVWAERGPDGLVLVVEDDGPGVPDEIKDSIFEPFDRGRATETTGGLGLGLSLVRRLAQSLDGDVWVEDAVSGGASFRVWIPTTG